MGDVLDQSEIDALLSAVDSGGGGAATALKAPPSAPEVFSSHGRSNVEVHTYDFKRPERVSKDQMRALEGLHEGFGRNFGAALSGYLRTIIEVSVATIEQLTYSEFIHSLPNPTCFNLLKAEQLDGQMCLEISPLIIYPIIDRLLGGSNADLFIPQRPLTQIEQRLVQRITDRATHFLSEAWSNLTPVTFSVQDFESNPQLVQIVPPNETVVVIGFELRMGNRAGTMSLCIPYNVIEPIMAQLSAQSWFSYQRRGTHDDSVKRVTRAVTAAPVEMRAVLARTRIRLSDLLSLQTGDLITTEKPIDSDIMVQIEGRNKFFAKLGKMRGKRAIQISRVMPETPVEPAPEPERRQMKRPRPASPPESGWTRYFKESESAFAALVFLLPFVVAYEIGTWYATFDPASHTEQRIVAFSMLQNSLAAMGATARWVAPAAVISVLASMAVFRREPFRPQLGTQVVMTVESLLLAGPLLLLGFALAKINLLAGPEPMSQGVVLSVGAGIYEEFIFRLLGLAALHFFFVDFLGIRPTIGTVGSVVGCGVLFSLYHYWGSESFAMQTFVFRAMAGTYFGGVMLSRGFGVTVGCHMAYDIAVCWMREGTGHHA